MHKGWFKIPGVQDGDRTVEQQLLGLETIAGDLRGRHVLDLGCGEGLIGRHCVDAWGATLVHGVTAIQYEIDEAVKQCVGRPMRFFRADLRYELEMLEKRLQGSYHAVLLLSILHKLRKPLECLEWATAMAHELVVIRLPAPTIVDGRSGHVPWPVRAWMLERFDLVGEPATCVEPVSGRPEWMSVWRRRA